MAVLIEVFSIVAFDIVVGLKRRKRFWTVLSSSCSGAGRASLVLTVCRPDENEALSAFASACLSRILCVCVCVCV